MNCMAISSFRNRKEGRTVATLSQAETRKLTVSLICCTAYAHLETFGVCGPQIRALNSLYQPQCVCQFLLLKYLSTDGLYRNSDVRIRSASGNLRSGDIFQRLKDGDISLTFSDSPPGCVDRIDEGHQRGGTFAMGFVAPSPICFERTRGPFFWKFFSVSDEKFLYFQLSHIYFATAMRSAGNRRKKRKTRREKRLNGQSLLLNKKGEGTS